MSVSIFQSAYQSILDGAREYYLPSFGDVEQAKTYSTAAMTSGSAILTVTGYTFTSSDIGKTVGVKGAGPTPVTPGNYNTLANDGVLVGTILSVNNGLATLSTTASATVSNADCVFGFPVDAALTAAIAKCVSDYTSDGVAGSVIIPSGKYIAVVPQPISSGVSIRGTGRDSSIVYVVKIVDDADNAITAPWISRESASGIYDNLHITDLTLIGTFYAATSGYAADMKMIHIASTSNSSVQRVRIVDNPSTAIGYDLSTNCVISDNIILNGGRLAEITSTTGSAGGSAIGIAVGTDVGDLGMIVKNNFIKGKWTASGGTGRSGINIEAASAIVSPPTYYGGIIIEGNIIEGYYNGIVDSGGLGTMIIGNKVRRCSHGIKSGTNGISAVGRVARDSIICNNHIYDAVSLNSTYYAIGIAVTTVSTTTDTSGRTMVHNNFIQDINGGYGMQLFGTSASYPLRNVSVMGNQIFDCDWSGIRVYGNMYGTIIAHNNISGNGQANISSNKAPIKIESTVVWEDGRLDSNTYTDYQAVPTQDATYSQHASAVLTNVTVIS